MLRLLSLAVVALSLCASVWGADVVFGGAGGELTYCGVNLQEACPSCCEGSACYFENLSSTPGCTSEDINCATLCPNAPSSSPSTTTTTAPSSPETTTPKPTSPSPTSFIFCGINIPEECPLCCDSKGCYFAEIITQQCPIDPKNVDCVRFCPQPYKDQATSAAGKPDSTTAPSTPSVTVTSAPTKAPTQTAAPTEAPTKTTAPTEAPTQTPAASDNDSVETSESGMEAMAPSAESLAPSGNSSVASATQVHYMTAVLSLLCASIMAFL